jgi:hypothetical protein
MNPRPCLTFESVTFTYKERELGTRRVDDPRIDVTTAPQVTLTGGTLIPSASHEFRLMTAAASKQCKPYVSTQIRFSTIATNSRYQPFVG